ncbi:TRAP transporter TatT component family protein [Salinicola halophilus]|uniref:TRAP transporter TatT component family protein n=1 Tax=Salinicola halophilus TaxID=184065 RepID=UPI001EF7A8E4|nr:TRAP transporter TatT component family protein [Salinicola halophilus]
MRLRYWMGTCGLAATLAIASVAQAQDTAPSLFPLMQRWGNVEYQMQGSAQEKAFDALASEVNDLAATHPDDVHVLTAQGVILASYARSKGGMGALGLAKQARAALERAIELDPQGEDGSALVTLGALYQHVPGWPIAFGDEERAGELFQRAVQTRPDGVDTNFYYAQYLEDRGEHDQAIAYAERAIDGDARDHRPSDESLRRDAEQWLEARR